MTFLGNAHMTVHFICGISFPTLEDEIVSSPSGNVSFAVQITCVTILNENQEMSDNSTITVSENVPYNVICEPGPSRPPPICLLFVGEHIVQTGTSMAIKYIAVLTIYKDLKTPLCQRNQIYLLTFQFQGPYWKMATKSSKNVLLSTSLRA